jgi:hypothetical protein
MEKKEKATKPEESDEEDNMDATILEKPAILDKYKAAATVSNRISSPVYPF